MEQEQKPLTQLKENWSHMKGVANLFYINLFVILIFMTLFIFSNSLGIMKDRVTIGFLICMVMEFLANLVIFHRAKTEADNIEEFRNYVSLKYANKKN